MIRLLDESEIQREVLTTVGIVLHAQRVEVAYIIFSN